MARRSIVFLASLVLLHGCASGAAPSGAGSPVSPPSSAASTTSTATIVTVSPPAVTAQPSPTPAAPATSTTSQPAPTASTSQPTTALPIVASNKGVGAFKFGAAESAVLAGLTPALGKPKTRTSAGGCEGAGGSYNLYATFGSLELRFAAKDLKASSPRVLASWTIRTTKASDGKIALASNVPFGLTLAQLQAKYPGGGGLEHMGAWAANGYVIIPPETAGQPTLITAGALDWCT